MVEDHEANRPCSLSRRRFLSSSAAMGMVLLIPAAARGAGIRYIEGGVSVNGKTAVRATPVRAGDLIETGPDSKLVFVIGQDAFLLRGQSTLKLGSWNQKGSEAIAGLRLVSGALLASFGKGRRVVQTTTVEATIRSASIYLELDADRTYFCTCHGQVDLRDAKGTARKVVVALSHTPNVIYSREIDGRIIVDAPVKDHTNEELSMLAIQVGRSSPFAKGDRQGKSAPSAKHEDGPEASGAPQKKSSKQSAKRPNQAPSGSPEPVPHQVESRQPGPESVTATEPMAKPPPAPPPAEPELRLPPARLE